MVDTVNDKNVSESSKKWGDVDLLWHFCIPVLFSFWVLLVNRLGPCEVCGTTEAKYTCPRCEVKTCCLACVNIHKKELECDGARNKLLYKPLSKFQNLDLLSGKVFFYPDVLACYYFRLYSFDNTFLCSFLDYRLLEDVTRSVQEIQRDPLKRVSRFLPGVS